MPLVALLLVVAALLPLVACLTLLATGRKLGTPLAGYVATFCIAVSFVCSGLAMMRWVSGGKYQGVQYGQNVAPISQTLAWLPIGSASHPNGFEQDHPGYLDFALFVDSLTVTLFLTITTVAMLVHIFATRSLRRDLRYVRFFTLLSLSCFAILAMLLCGSLLQMVLLLELVGLAASMLIGFRAERETTRRAATKMFVVSRIADVGLLLGVGMLVALVGNLTLPDLWMMLGGAGGEPRVALPGSMGIPASSLTVIGVALFLGTAARCAQFPFQVWAPDAAEGVAPAGATVFAVTLGLGGVYFIARIFPLLTPSARLLGAIIGSTTLVMAALIACVQAGIKQVLAWVAVSQLGLMLLAVCLASWSAGMLHLVTFVFFQTALFLAAGAVIRAARGESELSQFGGLWRRMPVTAVTSLVALLAACGAGIDGIGLSGYYSRELILRHAADFAMLATRTGHDRLYWTLFILPVFGTVLISFALARWWVLTFAGQPRERRLFGHARDVSTLFWPLVVLAIMTALTGKWMTLDELVQSATVEARQQARLQADASPFYRGAAVHVFDAVWPDDETADERSSPESPSGASWAPTGLSASDRLLADDLARRWFWIAVLLGIGGAALVYARGLRLAGALVRIPPLRWVHIWLTHRMYFDELYDALVVQPALGLAGAVVAADRKWNEVLAGLPRFVTRKQTTADRQDPPVAIGEPAEHRSGQPS
ncbi:MAG TPA: proton-conducting transporter membrane subunit [Tepidisphaeraceae bacterium]|nr:proton-conducting transporter membrane subunit [Tepidisphaeraceae bacterium]